MALLLCALLDPFSTNGALYVGVNCRRNRDYTPFKMEPVFKLGKRGLAVPMELHKMNRLRLCKRLRSLWSSGALPSPALDSVYVLLQGGSDVLHGGSDVEIVFRQVSMCLEQ